MIKSLRHRRQRGRVPHRPSDEAFFPCPCHWRCHISTLGCLHGISLELLRRKGQMRLRSLGRGRRRVCKGRSGRLWWWGRGGWARCAQQVGCLELTQKQAFSVWSLGDPGVPCRRRRRHIHVGECGSHLGPESSQLLSQLHEPAGGQVIQHDKGQAEQLLRAIWVVQQLPGSGVRNRGWGGVGEVGGGRQVQRVAEDSEDQHADHAHGTVAEATMTLFEAGKEPCSHVLVIEGKMGQALDDKEATAAELVDHSRTFCFAARHATGHPTAAARYCPFVDSVGLWLFGGSLQAVSLCQYWRCIDSNHVLPVVARRHQVVHFSDVLKDVVHGSVSVIVSPPQSEQCPLF
mmetsp:Transcript_26417/g.77025  ORF Transcript_26417/g.77025 Transcript_26417/m.77025 type:complete len:346 (+) Transcript_26417:145-1182(+)